MSTLNETSVCLTVASEEMLFKKIMARSHSGFPLNKIQVKGAAKKVLMEAYKSHSAKRDLQQQLKVTDEWFLYFTEKYPVILENMFKGKHGKSCFEKKRCSTEDVDFWHKNLINHISERLDNPEAEEALKNDPRKLFLGTVDNFLFRDRIGKYMLRGMWGVDDFDDISKKKSDENLACITAYNAAGNVAPVLVNIKSSRVSTLFKENFPKEWSIECNSSGWMDTNSIISYMHKFSFWLKKSGIYGPVVLILLTDNLYMHIDVTDFCEKKNIILCSLPKHIYETIVPDNSVQNVVARIRSSWKMLESVTRPNFSSSYWDILSNIPEKVLLATFKQCGIFPMDKSSIDLTNCKTEDAQELSPAEQALDNLEKVLPQRTLLQFQNSFPYQLWLNHVQNAALFNAWVKLKQKARGVTNDDSEDMYDEEFSDEIPECVEMDLVADSSPTPSEVEVIVPDQLSDQEPTSITIPTSHSMNATESDVAVALIQHLHSDDVHDTIAIALANMGDMESASKRPSDEDACVVPIKIPKEQLKVSRGKVDGRGVITSLMQNQSPSGKMSSPSMPVNPNTPRTTCKIISPELVEASVERRVAAGISFRAKVPPSVLAALRSNASPVAKRAKKESA